MTIPQIGIEFNLRKDWKMLFEKDTWFMWQSRPEKAGYVLRRFTVFNVFKWYFYQVVIWSLIKILKPLVLMADHYWTNVEGRSFKEITYLHFREAVTPIKFFRLGKEK